MIKCGSAWATDGCYKQLVYDHATGRAGNYPVCRDFAKNLNSLCGKPIPLYQTYIASGNPKLSMPNWSLITEFQPYLGAVADALNISPENIKYKALTESLSAGQVQMWIGNLNLDNHGLPETVIRLNGKTKRWLFNSLIAIDKKTYRYDDSFEQMSRYPFDAVIYGGRTFLLKENNWADVSRGYSINLYEPHKYKSAYIVCDFAYSQSP